jgi:hypothetical protein
LKYFYKNHCNIKLLFDIIQLSRKTVFALKKENTMKNAKIGFLLLSVFAFQNIQAKKDSPQQKAAAARQKAADQRRKSQAAKAAAVVEEDLHKVEVTERPLLKKEVVAESVSNNYTEQPDGTVIQTQVTVTPMPEENKVVTTTQTWTLKDAVIVGGKVFLGAAAIGAAGYLMYNNNETFKNGVDNGAVWATDKSKAGYQGLNNSLVDAQKYAAETYQAAALKADGLKNQFNNWRSGAVAQESNSQQAEASTVAPTVEASVEATEVEEMPTLVAPVSNNQVIATSAQNQSYWSRIGDASVAVDAQRKTGRFNNLSNRIANNSSALIND